MTSTREAVARAIHAEFTRNPWPDDDSAYAAGIRAGWYAVADRAIEAHHARNTALAHIAAERRRQHERWGQQDLPDGTGQYPETIAADLAKMSSQDATEGGYVTWLHVLREEVAEAFAESDPARLRAELVQVAAVAIQWIEAIDRRTAATEETHRD